MNQHCPYWSADSCNGCIATKGGMYIPTREHARIFCRSQLYKQCYHFQQIHNMLNAVSMTYGFIKNGRRHIHRMTRKIPVRLEKGLGMAGHPLKTADAFTVDISLSGMRLESGCNLCQGVMVGCTFNSSFSPDSPDGFTCRGFVNWCSSIDENGLFQAGLSVEDKGYAKAVGSHLGLIMWD